MQKTDIRSIANAGVMTMLTLTPMSGAGIRPNQSMESQWTERHIAETYEHLTNSQFSKKNRTIDAICDAYSNAQEEGWDGYDAEVASLASLQYAIQFINTLPMDFPMPEPDVDPDGEISLEWFQLPNKVFSISISGKGLISYAYRHFSGSGSGIEYFASQRLFRLIEETVA